MAKPTAYIRAAGEQYHIQTAVDKFGQNAVMDERVRQLGQAYPSVPPMLRSMQAMAEMGYSNEINEGNTPYKDVHKTLQEKQAKEQLQARHNSANPAQAILQIASQAMDKLCNGDSGSELAA